jgi:hypothetical protein
MPKPHDSGGLPAESSEFLKKLDRCDVIFGLDTASSVYLDADKVFRVVQPAGAEVIRKIAAQGLFETLHSYGVVATRICEEYADLPFVVLQHERIPFVTHPAEWSPQMVREAARFLVELSLKLRAHDLMLKDNHLLNVTFHRGKPVFLDFGSIVPFNAWLAKSWLKGFRARVLTAVAFAGRKDGRISNGILRTEPRGLGFDLSTSFPWSLMPPYAIVAQQMCRITGWESALRFLARRLRDRKIRSPENLWNDYGANRKEEKELKRKVILDEIARSSPASIHELAGNKGVIGEAIASTFGIPVCSSDYVAHCVQAAHERTRNSDLPLQVAVLDLLFPVPAYGAGSCRPGSADRLRAETTLATALIHHLVGLNVVSMDSFVRLVGGYASRSTIVEWVDPADHHLVNWKKDGRVFPENYTFDGFMAAFTRVFPHFRELPAHHETRRLFHFSRTPLAAAPGGPSPD